MSNTINWRGLTFEKEKIYEVTNIAVLVTNGCNSDCYHCFRHMEKPNKNINLELISRLSDYLKKSTVIVKCENFY